MCTKTKYTLRMVVGFAGYALGLVVLNYFYTDKLPHRYWLVFLPVLPLVYTSFVIVHYVTQLDELWRKIVTEAAAFSAIATGFTCFSYLFLRDMGAPEFHGEWAFYLMWLYYGIGGVFSWWRYR